MEIFENSSDLVTQYAMEYGIPLLKALLILIIGLWVIKAIRGAVRRGFKKSKMDESLQPFLISLIYNALLVLLILTVLSTLGIQMTSFVAIIGAAGLAVGLSLQGTLQNFAGGVIILIMRPFKVGDYVEAGGHAGVIKEIQIFNTIMTTVDNKRVIIPNGGLSNSSMVNYSAEPIRRVDMVFGIGYNDDIKKAKSILMEIIKEDKRVLADPEPVVVVGELGDSSVNFNVRPWVNGADYWDVYWETTEEVKHRFDKEGISIPFPQRDVHIYNEK